MLHAYKTVWFNLLRGCASFFTSKMMTAHAPWNQLPIDILSSIFECLDLEDRIRFDLVCKQWRTNLKRTPQLLWLMLPYDPSSQYLSLFDMYEGRVRKLNLPRSAQGGWFFGCSKGWLFLATGTNVDNLRIFLFGPISRAQIPLPPLSTISSFEENFTARRSGWNPAACIISGVEVSSFDASQCIVATTFYDNNKILALCKSQDERWIIVEGLLHDGYFCGNLSFFDGELYACILCEDREINNNQAPNIQTHFITLENHRVNLKLISSTPPPTYLLFAAVDDERILYHKDCSRWSYLVEANGQLLVVTKICDTINTWDYHDDNNDDDDTTFQITKIQTTADDTLHMTGLTDLGNQSLFLGAGDCLAVENCNKIDKNCIYFLDDMDYSSGKEYSLVSQEAGVYNVKDGSIKHCFPSIKIQNHGSFMYWFSPNIESRIFD
ncbi:F-box/kelch-repeat protein [Gossypium australe]|uniref:F-box/kelch-repeat protein n=1 Tax=Gossypium australe TaxID=47621 RepID=A0A5B6U6P0_9ROSI|nr:F-box/kelch-repeat protein [Gossypium australe]